MIPQAMGPARPKRGIRKYAPGFRKEEMVSGGIAQVFDE
jgi:hypothetical protein